MLFEVTIIAVLVLFIWYYLVHDKSQHEGMFDGLWISEDNEMHSLTPLKLSDASIWARRPVITD